MTAGSYDVAVTECAKLGARADMIYFPRDEMQNEMFRKIMEHKVIILKFGFPQLT